MRVEVDQSGKIEWTQKPTVLAFANGLSYTIQINPRDKRRILAELSRLKPRWSKRLMHIYTFSILLYFLLREHISKLDTVVIDLEYMGHDAVIKNRVLTLLRQDGLKVYRDQISFQRVGKKSPAHHAAIEVFRGKRRADKQLRAEDVLAKF